MMSDKAVIQTYALQCEAEAKSILKWWSEHMLDMENGGFLGSINNEGFINNKEKGIVLNARICWTFAAASIHFLEKKYAEIAERAFVYIRDFFVDKKFGGVYWSVNEKGEMLDGKKQIYGLAFTIYGLAELYKANGNEETLTLAKDLFYLIEKYSFDSNKSGYIEAFARDWEAVDDLRLSDKDDNEKKTMNTHLHIIEAYANLYTVWKEAFLRQQILNLLNDFEKHIINSKTHHLNLFFDENWQLHSSLISYGHDIEAAWLLLECAEIVADENYIQKYKQYALSLANAAFEGWDKNEGGLWYEYEPQTNLLQHEKHWWPQAEAMVGFLNAFQISNQERYLKYSLHSFSFIQKRILDTKNGEWYWGVDKDGNSLNKEKAGFWKCPYHNTRACLEVVKRLKTKD